MHASTLHRAALTAVVVLGTFSITTGATKQVTPHGAMLRYPDVSSNTIAFVYANDIWLVPREGGMASPLASPPGMETFPRFSPDEETLAFVGNYDGDRDLYTVPITGGLPVRVTHHPATETLCDWTPDGRLMFNFSGLSGLGRMPQLFSVGANGGLPVKLPVPYGTAASISPDGQWLAYTPYSRDTSTWKRYRGGMASDIWLFNLSTFESKKITDWEGTDTLPMWHGTSVYYLSDAGPNHKLNIWKFDTTSDRREQVTHFADYDVKWPSIGPGPRGKGEIVFQNGSSLHLLDLGNGKSTPVSVTIPGARPTIRTRQVDASNFIQWWQISSTGKRAVASARGDIWTLPAEHGSPRNLTRTSGAAERSPGWSPDGQWIAYFSDGTVEYELYITQSDGKGETRKLTSGSSAFYTSLDWSPDSKFIVMTDKAGQMILCTVETGETKVIDKEPWGTGIRPRWSHDSRWISYARSLDDHPTSTIWVHEVETGQNTQLTSGMFSDSSPVFDRKGDYLYFVSSRSFSPTYSDVDASFIYQNSNVILVAPLRADVESPWLAESDEEKWDKDADDEDEEKAEEDSETEENAGESDDEAADEAADEDEESEDEAEPAEDDGVTGTWEGTVTGAEIPPGMEFTMTLRLEADGTLTGHIVVPIGSGEIEATYDKVTGEVMGTVTTSEGDVGEILGHITGESIELSATIDDAVFSVKGKRTSTVIEDESDEKKKDADKDKPREVVEIVFDGFEQRTFALPIKAGSYGDLEVNHKNKLLFVRGNPDGPGEIMLFDLEDDKKEEKSVLKGSGSYEISADGKKLLAVRQGGASILDASAGATAKNVVTSPMTALIEPRDEWLQLFTDAWRLQRDYFYVDNLHGVDWPAVHEHYAPMIADCVTREDVSYVISEMISELNIGHAYYFGGDGENEPSTNVGMLGVDWELDGGAYRIADIVQGGAWDVDARNPLRQGGLEINQGDYLLAVNGVPVNPDKDPWAAFVGTAGQTITLTVSDTPENDDEARDVVVKPVSGESNLRYRAWIEHNRAYVDEKSNGQIGYIFVPNTGINGQNDLVRQYFGQAHKKALIIDERWNGGGQIPTRFIEMLNRPITNYWARRDLKDFKWPPDAHHGPKCMLINGLAGSGGDMFPWLFKQAGLGPLIGTRTWGGLVGISGNPSLIDGGVMTVPTFGFYEKDGTWGIEGHGVDPDIEVIDDPAKMLNGADPQLDTAIDEMLAAIEREPYIAPSRPSPPNRAGMGITEEDK